MSRPWHFCLSVAPGCRVQGLQVRLLAEAAVYESPVQYLMHTWSGTNRTDMLPVAERGITEKRVGPKR